MKYKLIRITLVVCVAIVTSVAILYQNSSSSIVATTNENEITVVQQYLNEFSHLTYYNDDFIDRYYTYKENNPTLSIEDIVTHVNMYIDYPFYTIDPFIIEDTSDYTTLLVNKVYSLAADYVPENLVTVDSMYSKQLVDYAAEAFLEMADHCQEQGFNIYLQSGYRSYDYQSNIYSNMITVYGEEYTNQYSAKPGHSEHQLGLAADISINGIHFDYTGDNEFYDYLYSIFTDYGFILRYPEGCEHLTGYSYESWHVRYVGVEQAKKVESSGLTFDEYMARQ